MPTGLTLWNFRAFHKAIDPKSLQPELRRELAKATRRNGLLAVREVRQTIRRGVPPANAPLTIEIKGSDKPLVDKGSGLFQAITSVQVGDLEVFVGVLRTDKHYNIGLALHEGAAAKVTDKMRALFNVLWHTSTGRRHPASLTGRAAELWERKPGGWMPLRPSTTVIKIPPRPFMEIAFKSKDLQRRVMQEWEQAVQRALTRNARK
jgi:hypothetical protein